MSDSGKRFFTEFISDYFAECEEHLARVRRDLLALENLVNQGRMDVTLGNNLLRSFHTIKGLSGMVGQKEAQELAHEMESYLRALLRNQGRHSVAGQDALVHGLRALEQVLAAARDG
ncbi:MAG: Hpt domain-containing protein [Desulfobacterales bacterium]|nr:Hpt domain-containing protein [Pseudomonadota bacterium]MBU4356809.1 Hpt domain-containing protein [Pseudomonadota bacterium]MCG2772311.1 Hpt domain-containing protein [Desulfobacterales bacterium]